MEGKKLYLIHNLYSIISIYNWNNFYFMMFSVYVPQLPNLQNGDVKPHRTTEKTE